MSTSFQCFFGVLAALTLIALIIFALRNEAPAGAAAMSSGIPPKALLRYVPRVADLADKVLWGTDWPSPGVVSPRKNVDDFLALNLGEEVTRKILWENAARLFP